MIDPRRAALLLMDFQNDIVDILRPSTDELVVTKKRVGAFSTTNLASELTVRDVDKPEVVDAAELVDHFSP